MVVQKVIDILMRFTSKEKDLEGIVKSEQKVGKFNKAIGKANMFLSRMRFEFLGVMFFGQSMKRLFGDMLKPALNLVGAFDIWNTTLAVTFLPTALELLEKVFIPMLDFFTSLPEGVQTALGSMALFGLAVGGILDTIGQVTLGLIGLNIAFGKPAIDSANNLKGAVGGAKSGIITLGKSLKKLAGVGILIAIATDVLGRGEDFTLDAKTFAKDIGLAGIAGFLMGGPGGAFGTILIMMGVDIIQEDIKNMKAKLQEVRDSVFLPEFSGVEAPFARGEAYTVPPQFFGGSGQTIQDFLSQVPFKITLNIRTDTDLIIREE